MDAVERYKVVLVEGPVHREEIARRIAAFWGAQRTTSRTIAAVDAALEHAVAKRRLQADGDFFRVAGETTIRIRSRESVVSTTLSINLSRPTGGTCHSM